MKAKKQRTEEPEAPIVPGGQFGDAATSNLVIRVGSGDKQCEFRAHWETLSVAFEYFASMQKSNMTEAQNNTISFPDDDPVSWHILLSRCYPPPDYTVAHAIRILPLLKFMSATLLLEETETFIRTCSRTLRRAEHVDALVAIGRQDLLKSWFLKADDIFSESDEEGRSDAEDLDSDGEVVTEKTWAMGAIAIFMRECRTFEGKLFMAEKLAKSFSECTQYMDRWKCQEALSLHGSRWRSALRGFGGDAESDAEGEGDSSNQSE